jgi:hypothetical protein
VSCCRFWWVFGHVGLLQELKLKARDQRKGYQEVMGVTVHYNLSHGTANLLRCTLSVVVKSLSEKCLLHNNLLRSILAESIVQDIPTLPAHTRAL